MELLQHLKSIGDLSLGSQAWLCCLVRDAQVLIKHKDDVEGEWHFVLGESCAVAALTWPALEEVEHGKMFFSPDCEKRCEKFGFAFKFILNPEDWVAWEFSHISPLRAATLPPPTPTGLQRRFRPLRFMASAMGPRPLLKVSAMNSCWKLPLFLFEGNGGFLQSADGDHLIV